MKFKRVANRGKFYAVVVLKALMLGHTFELGGHTFAMGIDGQVGVLMRNGYLSGCSYLSVGALVKMCEKLPEATVVALEDEMASLLEKIQ